jgi:hypothetical protein
LWSDELDRVAEQLSDRQPVRHIAYVRTGTYIHEDLAYSRIVGSNPRRHCRSDVVRQIKPFGRHRQQEFNAVGDEALDGESSELELDGGSLELAVVQDAVNDLQ